MPNMQKNKILNRQKFEMNQKVLVQTSMIEGQNKLVSKYNIEGTIRNVLDNDSYLVQISMTGKIIKKNHSQLVKA